MIERAMTAAIVFMLLSTTLAVLPEVSEFEQVFKGEGIVCDGTFAKVESKSQQTVRTEEQIIQAIASAVAQSSSTVTDTASAVAAANATAHAVLEVVAEAVASISAEINSPAPSCWALAFGKAQAIAIANATVTAVAQGISEAFGEEVTQTMLEASAKGVESDIDKSIKTIAVLLADGSGKGRQFQKEQVTSQARAKVINCALASAFAQVLGQDSSGEVITQTGCSTLLQPRAFFFADTESGKYDGCACVTQQQGNRAKPMCGKWGDFQNGDNICYVQNPQACDCAYKSGRYDNMAWRYCGPSMKVMQDYMNFEDEENDIEWHPEGYGFCSKTHMTYEDDPMAPEEWYDEIDESPQPNPPQQQQQKAHPTTPKLTPKPQAPRTNPQQPQAHTTSQPLPASQQHPVQDQLGQHQNTGNSATGTNAYNTGGYSNSQTTNPYQTGGYSNSNTPAQQYQQGQINPPSTANSYNYPECPTIPCIGQSKNCCYQNGEETPTCYTGYRMYYFGGRCGQQGNDVWKSQYGFKCSCGNY